ncbi:PREDICTED: uncharacterized protein LOC107194228 [Dufourea novaeangliae]|uniref:uncharacterized protein LOC107194228 n=1 Tax=Dufourea novaeangliae TaxID=178035 RepID=UPI0007672052|nr:PREDICTED: uncharacterized protein LOC107194228 [Dufourea novaeangliae]
MDAKTSQCMKCEGDVVVDTGHCPKCSSSSKFLKKSGPLVTNGRPESVKVPVKPPETGYVMQIVSIGIRPDSVYEARMLLAPEADMSSIKITVKGNNLRVNVCKPLNEQLASQLPEITEKSVLGDLVKRTMKHCENLLIPDDIDGEKVRAVVDNKHRMLILTAPTMKPSKVRKKLIA